LKVLFAAGGLLALGRRSAKNYIEEFMFDSQAKRSGDSANSPPDPPINRILVDTDDFVEVTVGISQWTGANGLFFLEKDYRVAGEVWRVHKGDADPFPSKPHAHCIGGAKRFVGCKLHLGTAELYSGNKASGRFLYCKQFDALIELIRPKFPRLILPLEP
jgi:hypothetical protein